MYQNKVRIVTNESSIHFLLTFYYDEIYRPSLSVFLKIGKPTDIEPIVDDFVKFYYLPRANTFILLITEFLCLTHFLKSNNEYNDVSIDTKSLTTSLKSLS